MTASADQRRVLLVEDRSVGLLDEIHIVEQCRGKWRGRAPRSFAATARSN